MKKLLIFSLAVLLLAGCGAMGNETEPAGGSGMGMGMGMGPGGGMYERHHADIPVEYASLKSPALDDAALARAADLYVSQCASCHGSEGNGDGPVASSLNPAPSPISHTSQMMGDGYLFWRISEGGVAFTSAMPAWKSVLSESDIWGLIGYMRALGQGTAGPDFEARQHEEMLSKALAQGLITQTDADTFTIVHDALNKYQIEHPSEPGVDHDAERENMLEALVSDGTLTQVQVDSFNETHQRLIDAGLMR